MLNFIDEEINQIKRMGLYRSLRTLDGHQGPRITIDGRECLNLCSNNYLGLANNPKLKQAAIEAVQRYGCGAGASRLVSGNFKLYEELESRIARFTKQEVALVFNSGYATNLGVITALVGRGDIVFSDRLNHASIVDAIILSKAEFRRYPHKDMAALENILRGHKDSAERSGASPKGTKSQGHKKLIVTDTLFSMDGDIAPLPEIVELAKKYDAMVMVDEAHATGVFGEKRTGLVEHFGLEDDIDVHMGTLSKSFGNMGGYVAGSKSLIDYLVNKSRSLIYTTALAPAVLASSLAAIDIVSKDNWMTKTLWENANNLKRGLIDLGFNLLNSASQIMPLMVGEADKAVEFSRGLFEEGIFCQAIRPPTVPKGEARLRLTVMATHKKQDLEKALVLIGKVAKRLGLIP